MKVDGVLARGEALEVEMDAYAERLLDDDRGADFGSLGVAEGNNLGGLLVMGKGKGSRGHQDNGEGDTDPDAFVHR
jgi:hypothetical protein